MDTRTKELILSKPATTAIRIVLGGIFIYASFDKIANPLEFASAIQSYRILPDGLVRPLAYALPWIELILGLFLVLGLFVRKTSLALLILLVVFLVASVYNSLDGSIEDCGCFKPSSLFYTTNLFLFFLRDAAFLALGLFVYLTSRPAETPG